MKRLAIGLAFTLAVLAANAASPSPPAPLAIGLAEAHRLAQSADPRLAELQLERRRSELRLQNIRVEGRPSLSLQGSAQYQSEVVEIPLPTAPSPSKDTYDACLHVDQTLLDPPRRARMEAERARLAEAQARIEVAVYGLRREVDESFFSAALLQEREAQIAGSIAALEARGGQAQARVEQGAALPSEAAAVEAVLLQRREDREEVGANRHAALQRLGRLIGRELDPEKTALEAPALDALFDRARAESLTGRDRPEFSHFAALRRGAQAERDLAATARLPRLTAYARAGYGIPGFDFLRNDLHAYGLAGVRLQWKPFDWGSAGREEQIALLRQRALEAEEAALEAAIDRAIQEDLAAADHLRQTAAADHRIVALRELIERETLARLDEGVVNAAEYLDKETELLEARLRLATHRLELARAQARVLNTLGVEIP